MSNKKMWLAAFIVCLVLATVSPLASSAPDGLERVAEDKGFIEMGRVSPFSIVADYAFPWVDNYYLATMLAGWLGTILVFLVAYGIAKLIYRLKDSRVHS